MTTCPIPPGRARKVTPVQIAPRLASVVNVNPEGPSGFSPHSMHDDAGGCFLEKVFAVGGEACSAAALHATGRL
ncbi:hypothetical protein V9K92_02225 [Phyllobacterium sp. CCNWLW109]|uniref:hypothetical protein n=1 Tax=Phyllobacterium sp. CCNWLW109 TaxID=3127479 RepID=UPI003076ED73